MDTTTVADIVDIHAVTVEKFFRNLTASFIFFLFAHFPSPVAQEGGSNYTPLLPTVVNLQLPLLKSSHVEYSCDNISLVPTHFIFIAHSLSCYLESEFFYLTTFKNLGLGLFSFVTSPVSLFIKNYLSL